MTRVAVAVDEAQAAVRPGVLEAGWCGGNHPLLSLAAWPFQHFCQHYPALSLSLLEIAAVLLSFFWLDLN